MNHVVAIAIKHITTVITVSNGNCQFFQFAPSYYKRYENKMSSFLNVNCRMASCEWCRFFDLIVYKVWGQGCGTEPIVQFVCASFSRSYNWTAESIEKKGKLFAWNELNDFFNPLVSDVH